MKFLPLALILFLFVAVPEPSYGFGINVEAETKLGDKFWLIRKLRQTRHSKLKQGIHERITREALDEAERNRPFSRRYPALRKQVIYGLLFNDDPGGYLFPRTEFNPKGYKYTRDSGGAIVNGIKWMQRFGLVLVQMKRLYLVKKEEVSKKKIIGRILRARGARKRKKLEKKLQSDILWASHFGDLQYLHAMGLGNESRDQILTKMRGFAEHAWSIVSGKLTLACFRNEIKRAKQAGGKLVSRNRSCPQIGKSHIQRRTQLMKRFDESDALFHTDVPDEFRFRALGSLLHMVQDSYAKGHAVRERWEKGNDGRIKYYQNYAEQDGDKHGAFDIHSSKNVDNWDKIPGAKTAMRRSSRLITYFTLRCSWEGSRSDKRGCHRSGVKGYLFNRVFALAPLPTAKTKTRSHAKIRETP